MRHGEAEHPQNFTRQADVERKLTTLGVKEASTMGKWLANNTTDITQCFVSPYQRAQQTSKEVLLNLNNQSTFGDESTGDNKRIACSTLDFITPSGNPKTLHDYLDGFIETDKLKSDKLEKDKQRTKGGSILIISHMPYVSYLVEALTATSTMPMFATASVVEIDYNENNMTGEYIRMIAPAQSE